MWTQLLNPSALPSLPAQHPGTKRVHNLFVDKGQKAKERRKEDAADKQGEPDELQKTHPENTVHRRSKKPSPHSANDDPTLEAEKWARFLNPLPPSPSPQHGNKKDPGRSPKPQTTDDERPSKGR
jgi:hypothetical protein